MAEIQLTHGKIAIVDDADLHLVSRWKWKAKKGSGRKNAKWYAMRYAYQRSENGKQIYRWIKMHRLLLPGVDRVDHRNGNTLDNQRCNLRRATVQQNSCNRPPVEGHTSKYKGVYLDTYGGYRAKIDSNGERRNLGRFHCEEDAARAYDVVAKELFGEFAHLNFPDQ